MSQHHIGIIPDGNRRWARKQAREVTSTDDLDDSKGTVLEWLKNEHPVFVRQIKECNALTLNSGVESLLVAYGHWRSAMQMKEVWKWSRDEAVKAVSIWGLSRQNVEKRDGTEVSFLNHAYKKLLTDLDKNGSIIHRDNVQVEFKGDRSLLERHLVRAIDQIEQNTADYSDGQLNIALGYDGLWDTTQAAISATQDQIVTRLREHGDEVTTESDLLDVIDAVPADGEAMSALRSHLELSDLDILLAYGPDRCHISHFANLQIGYSTIHFPTAWAEMTDEDLERLRFGEVAEKVLSKKHWLEAEKADISRAIQKHKFRSKTDGA